MIAYSLAATTVEVHHAPLWPWILTAAVVFGGYLRLKQFNPENKRQKQSASEHVATSGSRVAQVVAAAHQPASWACYSGGGKMALPYEPGAGAPRVLLAPPYITDRPSDAYLSDGTHILVQGH